MDTDTKNMSLKKILFLAFILFRIAPLSALAADPTYPIIDPDVCVKPVAEGGWGGDCQYILVDFSSIGLGESNGCTSGKVWAGYCGKTGGDWSDLDNSCCVPNGSSGQGPLVGEAFYRDSACTLPKSSGGSYGGTCKSSCATGEKYAGACGETDSPCCVSGDTAVPSETGKISSSSIGKVGAANVGTDYAPLENVPFINGTTFQDYVRGVYILGMVLVVIAAVFMLVIGGFQYLTSAGNTAALSAAKHTIEGALFGLVLALVAYLILYVINPDLTSLNISSFAPLAQRGSSVSGTGGTAAGGGSAAACAGGVVPIPSGISVKPGTSGQICKDLADKLLQLRQNTPGVSWRITSTFDGVHQSQCHKPGNAKTGSCADIAIDPNPGYHSASWNALCSGLSSISGISFLNEASSNNGCQSIRPFTQTEHATAAHIHVNFTGN